MDNPKGRESNLVKFRIRATDRVSHGVVRGPPRCDSWLPWRFNCVCQLRYHIQEKSQLTLWILISKISTGHFRKNFTAYLHGLSNATNGQFAGVVSREWIGASFNEFSNSFCEAPLRSQVQRRATVRKHFTYQLLNIRSTQHGYKRSPPSLTCGSNTVLYPRWVHKEPNARH